MTAAILLTQELHDIAPPVDYSLLSPWLVFLVCVISLLVLGLLVWLARKYLRREAPVRSPRERTLETLSRAEPELVGTAPYLFSIRVSDVLRRYVVDQYRLPMTRQTSVEFLTAIAGIDRFRDEERTLLEDFLSRCDLIKFARYDATVDDSRRLLEEARKFVEGGALVPV